MAELTEIQRRVTLVLHDLESYHGTELTEKAFKDYLGYFSTVKPEEFSMAVAEWKEQHGPHERYPSMIQLRQCMETIRVRRHEAEKKNSPTFADVERSVKSQHSREAFQLIYDFLDHKITRNEYLEKMAAMDEKYPGLGWLDAAKDLQKFWAGEKERHAEGAQVLAAQRRDRIERKDFDYSSNGKGDHGEQ